jgi:hypothetical protein
MIQYQMTASDLVVPCPAVNPTCPYPNFSSELYRSFDKKILLAAGDYRLEAHAYALNFMAPTTRQSIRDGAGVFDFRFKEIPEPPSLLLLSFPLLALVRQNLK